MKRLLLTILFISACSYNYLPTKTASVNDLVLSKLQVIKVAEIQYSNSGRDLVTRNTYLKEQIKTNLNTFMSGHEIIDSNSGKCGSNVLKLSTNISSFKSEPANSQLTIYMNLQDCNGTSVWHGSYLIRENDRLNNIAGGANPNFKVANIESLLNSAISSLIKGLKSDFQQSMLK